MRLRTIWNDSKLSLFLTLALILMLYALSGFLRPVYAQGRTNLAGPGVIGVLPLGNGGTGYSAASVAGLRTYLGVSSTADMTAALALKANLASPTFTGVVTGTFSGALTGNVTGNVSGSSGSTTGNAAGLVDGNGTLEYDNGGGAWVFGGDVGYEVQADKFVGPLTGDVTGNADTATTATNLGSTAIGIPKIGASGAPSAASGADVAALLTATNIVTSGTVTSPSLDPSQNPASHNYVAWTAQPERITSATTQNAGVAQAMKVWVPKSIRITGLSVYLNANMTATAANINGLAVYSSAGTLLAYTDDQASAWSDAGNLTKIVNAPITKDPAGGAISYLDVTGGDGVFVYFVLVSSTSGTKPSFGLIPSVNGAITNAGLSTGLSCGYRTSTTSWPTTPGALTLTASGAFFWIGAY